jgi:cytochrome c oxidase subunit 2
MSSTPLGYLDAAGPRAHIILPLTWFTLLLSLAVCITIAALLWMGVRRSRTIPASDIRSVPVARGGDGIRWITVGLLISAVPLLITLVWTMVALARVAGPPAHPGLTLDITAHQWWWEVRYDSDRASNIFATANEIHIPVGVPVLVRLHGGDVIHSFWVPKLSGKTDAIPGQTNFSWMQAQAPGRYRGQCSEYCGDQHANMAFEVVAEPLADFEQWRSRQLQAAPAPATAAQQHGLSVVEYRCGLCHQVRGTRAGAVSAPDLTHLMSRRMIAAGTLPNNAGTLAGWIQNAQQVKPRSLMPNQYLTGPQLSDVEAYLELLK